MYQWKCCLSMRATPCCFSLLSLSMPSVSALSGMSAERSKVRSSLPCSAHQPRIFPSLRQYPLRPFSSSPKQSLIIVISCWDFTSCCDRPQALFRFPVLPRYTSRDLPCRYKNSYVPLRTPTVLADCTLLFSPLLTPDLRRSSSSSSMPLMGLCISGLVLSGFLGQAARYCCTSCCFCMSCLTVRWQATLAKTAWMRSVAGAKFSSISESSSPNWSSSYISNPPSLSFEQICRYDCSSNSLLRAEMARDDCREWGRAGCGLLTMALMIFCMFFFLSCATLLGGDSGQAQLWMSFMLSRLYISGMITSF